MSLKDSWNLLLLILALAFLPSENWRYWFSDAPAHWYGEVKLRSGAAIYLVGRNAGADAVNIGSAVRPRVAAVATLSGGEISLSEEGHLPPGSMAIVEVDGEATRLRRIANTGVLFEPGFLRIATEGEDDALIVLLVLGVLLIGALGVSVGFFFFQGLAPLADRKT